MAGENHVSSNRPHGRVESRDGLTMGGRGAKAELKQRGGMEGGARREEKARMEAGARAAHQHPGLVSDATRTPFSSVVEATQSAALIRTI
jgi:hypothetical protein